MQATFVESKEPTEEFIAVEDPAMHQPILPGEEFLSIIWNFFTVYKQFFLYKVLPLEVNVLIYGIYLE